MDDIICVITIAFAVALFVKVITSHDGSDDAGTTI